jgi:hypothetical protein
MPRIERFFAGQGVPDWTSGALGGGGGAGGVVAAGGDISVYPNPAGGYWQTHVFSSTGNFTLASGSVDADILILGGGAGGSWVPSGSATAQGGGGGAGAWIPLPAEPLSPTGGPGGDGVYPVVIAAAAAQNTDGNTTTGFGETAPGGGTGGQTPPATGAGNPGASGGGGTGGSPWYNHPSYAGGTATHPSGNPGGSGGQTNSNIYLAAGGGGGSGPAGGAGGAFPWPQPHETQAYGGAPGPGSSTTLINGSTVYLAAGGSGYGAAGFSPVYPSFAPNYRTDAGGGDYASDTNNYATGGVGWYTASPLVRTSGGQGAVVVRFPVGT